MRARYQYLALGASLLLAACGGGGGDAAVEAPADVQVSLSVPATPVASGARTSLTVAVSNSTSKEALSLGVATLLGNGLTLNGVSCKANGAAVCPSVLTGATVQLASLPGHSGVTLTFDVTVASGLSGEIKSEASAGAAAKSSGVMRVYSADVSLSASTLGPVLAGSPVQHVFTLANAGPDAARELKLALLPDGGVPVGALTCKPSSGAVCPTVLGQETQIAELPKGASLVFTAALNAPVDGVASFGTTASVQPAGDPNTANNSVQSTVRVIAPNFVQLDSDWGDYIGGGRSYRYDQTVARLGLSAAGRRISVDVQGDQRWSGSFTLPDSVSGLVKGSYDGLTRDPFSDSKTGGLEWWGEGRGCNTLLGSLSLDNVVQEAGELRELDFRFVQHCEGGASALRGKVHWTAYDKSVPAGPKDIPAGLWDAPAGSTPATGNYVYLSSQPGDYIGGGLNYLYTSESRTLFLGAAGNSISIAASDGANDWTGQFVAMLSLSQLAQGYYSGLQRYPFHNAMKGGFSWSGSGRGCNQLNAWVAIDKISYSGSSIAAIDMRFEQHCEGMAPALRGKVHWVF